MTITTLPSAPLPSDNTATFNAKAFALVAALNPFVDETNAVAVESELNKSASDASKFLAEIAATNASTSEANALSYASAAAANTNTPRWVSGTTYALGSLVYSPVTGRSYRRSVAGAGTTDPSSDSTNWTALLLEAVTNLPTIRPSLLLDFANTEQLDPRITFARASTASFYDTDGILKTAALGVPRFDHNPVTGESLGLLIEGQATNLLTYSEQFDNAAWTKQNCTVAANTVVAPDGTISADTLTVGPTGYAPITRGGITITANTAQTISLYVKAGTGTSFTLTLANASLSSGYSTVFNLSTGTVTSLTPTGTASSGASTITPVGNGWFRATLTAIIDTSTTAARIDILFGLGLTAYLWGAQFESNNFASSYIPTVASQVTRSADSASMTGSNFSSWYRADEGSLFARTTVSGYSSTNPDVIALSQSTNPSGNAISMFLASAGPNYRANITASSVNQLLQNCVYAAEINNDISFCIAYKTNDSVSYATNVVNGVDTSVIVPSVDQLTFGPAGGIRKHIKRIAYYPKRISNTELQGVTV